VAENPENDPFENVLWFSFIGMFHIFRGIDQVFYISLARSTLSTDK
jgi:hypothetical protein